MNRRAEIVWNRAALERGGSDPREGDVALSATILAHSLIMDGGVLHALDVLSDEEFVGAAAGYASFGFADVAALLVRAQKAATSGELPEEADATFDAEYAGCIPDDGRLFAAFETDFDRRPDRYA